MAGYNSSTFLVSSTPSTDKVLRFRNIKGDIIGGFNVCNYKSITAEKKILQVNLDEGNKIILDFASNSDAKTAFGLLSSAVELLYPNCLLEVPGPPASPVVVTTTKALFDIDRGSGSVIPNTVYEVQDVSNDFSLPVAGTFHLIPLEDSPVFIKGFNIVDKTFVTLDFDSNKISEYYDPTHNIKIHGDLSLFVPTGVSTNVESFNSTLVIDTVTKIEVKNSTLTIDDSANIKVENSTLVLSGSTNSYFYGVTGDYSGYSLDNCIVDTRNINSGKKGRETLSLVNAASLNCFIVSIIQEVQTLSVSIYKTLDNPIPSVGTKFIFKVPTGGVGVGKTLTLKNSGGSTLIAITDRHAGQDIILTWNTSTLDFDVTTPTATSFYINITVGSNGQTSFVDILPYTISNPSETQLFVNGIKQSYGVDYTIATRSLTWLNYDFTLSTTDKVELYASIR